MTLHIENNIDPSERVVLYGCCMLLQTIEQHKPIGHAIHFGIFYYRRTVVGVNIIYASEVRRIEVYMHCLWDDSTLIRTKCAVDSQNIINNKPELIIHKV